MATLNISLTAKLKAFVDSEVESGDYDDASAFFCDLLRKDMERRAVIAEINAALDEGEASGYTPYVREEFEARLELLTKKQNAA